jgi:hypothetical protein
MTVPDLSIAARDPRHVERFWQRVELSLLCWRWTGAKSGEGYGQMPLGHPRSGPKSQAPAHRFAYELLVGPIPDGHVLHHLCGDRACVRPEHLLAVTPTEHTYLDTASVYTRAKTHCPQGHPYDYVDSRGRRRCRRCTRAAQRRWQERRRSGAGPMRSGLDGAQSDTAKR